MKNVFLFVVLILSVVSVCVAEAKSGRGPSRGDALPSPHVTFRTSPVKPVVNETVHLMGDYDKRHINVKKEVWNFGDGTVLTATKCCGIPVAHIYRKTGAYNASLTVTDSKGVKYRKTLPLVVEAVMPPKVVITAQEENGVYEANSGQTMPVYEFPGRVKFDLNRSKVQGHFTEVDWDFGDGHKGFGENPEWIYHKPGTYIVKVKAKDSKKNIGTASIVVVVYSKNCPSDGFESCLSLKNSQGNVFPWSQTEWTLGKSNDTTNFTFANLSPGWISLKSLGGQIPKIVVPLDDAVTVRGGTIHISRSALDAKNIDLSLPYAIEVSIGEYSGIWPRIYFGVGTLDVTTIEDDVDLVLENTFGYKRFVKMGTRRTYSFTDLPQGGYVLRAQKGQRSYPYQLTIDSSKTASVKVNIDAQTVERMWQDDWKYLQQQKERNRSQRR